MQRPEDVAEAKELIRGRAWVMVKLEKPQALDNLDAIMQLTDAVMVARGDLGVELPPEEVPLAQKRIVRLARQLGKPVVVATQMLESMISAPAPTRAEASDVATAVFDGADAVMLSGETAAGQYPVRGGQHDGPHRRARGAGSRLAGNDRGEPRGAGARHRGRDRRRCTTGVPYDRGEGRRRLSRLRAATALRVARERPEAPIIGLTPNIATARRMAVVWGLHAMVAADAHSMTEAVTRATRVAQTEGFAAARRRNRGCRRRAVRPFRHHQFASRRDGKVAD